ncbi:hypothetical protein [Bradyrhizobium sp. F1.4.3]|uniref:hypothetical protein n=1 Tax=Bradyrhizobium sp. F1.4.3 TaxID=3156356 RepID=UPI00339829AE
MAGAAIHSGLPRHRAEQPRRIEGEIAQVHQVRLAAGALGLEHFARLVEGILVQLSRYRQHGFVAVDWESYRASEQCKDR